MIRIFIMLLALLQLMVIFGVIFIVKKHHEAQAERQRIEAEKLMAEQVRQKRLAFPLEDKGD